MKILKKIILVFWKETMMKKSTFYTLLTLLDENILYNEISWFLHGPTVHEISLNLFAEEINMFCIKQKEGFKSVWPKHTSWISHGAMTLTCLEIYIFTRGRIPF